MRQREDKGSDLVSLVMPVWQPHEQWLQQAVESCLAQTHSNLELIVIDDGCAVPVASLLRHFDDPRLRIIRTPHGGVSNARNVGVAACDGRWIRFVDGDDVLPPGSIRALLEAASASFPIVYGQTEICDERLTRLGTLTCRREGHVLIAGIIGKLGIMLQAMLFERALLASGGGFDTALELMEDHDFVLRATALAQVRSVGEIVYVYRQHSSSSSRQVALDRSVDCWTYVRDRFFERHPELKDRLKRRVDALIQLQRARAFASGGQLRLALGTVLRAVAGAPGKAAVTGASILRGTMRPSRSRNIAESIGRPKREGVSRSTTP